MMQDRAPTPPPFAPPGYASTGYDNGESSDEPASESWRDRHPSLPRFALPAALIVGIAITASSTYALVAWVQRLQANASVDSDISKWKAAARDEVYNACYFGCDDCADPSFAFNACQKTAQAKVKGLVCDGNLMWNWRGDDKFPDSCLVEVGKILMGDALQDLKSSYRNRLAMIILTVLAGVVGGAITFFLVRRFTRSKSARQAEKTRKPALTRSWRPNTSRKEKPPKSTHHSSPPDDNQLTDIRSSSQSPARRSRSSSRSSSNSRRGGNGRRGFRFFAAFLALFSHSKPAHAYACTGHDIAWNQFFVMNPTPTTGAKGPAISGIIHGWLSNCYDKDDCRQDCHQTCKTVDGKNQCSDSCTKRCTKKTYTDRDPKSYVDVVIPKVKACGFQLVDALGGNGVVNQRVANGNIERNLWVKISVNGFNVTSGDKTDSGIMCLHAIEGR